MEFSWQNLPSYMDPVLFTIGPVPVRWYGMMYIVALIVVYLLSSYRINREQYPVNINHLQEYLLWGFLGAIIGGRVGYILFYGFEDLLNAPLQQFLPVSFSNGIQIIGFSGMSFHGGLIGVALATIIYSRIIKVSFTIFVDLVVPAFPLGYMFGRIGNFINGELYGRATNVPWGMYFPTDNAELLRHPSQLYEAFFEGAFLFLILWLLRKKMKHGISAPLYLIGYGIIRFFIEFAREPDSHIGLVWGSFSMGQLLCFCMVLIGIVLAIILPLRHRDTKRKKI